MYPRGGSGAVTPGNYTPLGCLPPGLGEGAPLQPVDVGPRLGQLVAGGGELVLQAHDRLGGGQRVAVVEQAAHPGGDGELRAGGGPVAAGGAMRLQDAGGVEAAQEGGLHAEQLGGLAHGERREVRVPRAGQGVRGRFLRHGARPPVRMCRGAGPVRARPLRDAADQASTALLPDSCSIVRLSTEAGVSARVTWILRARAFSATGMLRVSTPSW